MDDILPLCKTQILVDISTKAYVFLQLKMVNTVTSQF